METHTALYHFRSNQRPYTNCAAASTAAQEPDPIPPTSAVWSRGYKCEPTRRESTIKPSATNVAQHIRASTALKEFVSVISPADKAKTVNMQNRPAGRFPGGTYLSA